MDIKFEDLDSETIYQILFSNYRMHPDVANRFREQMIDGYVLSRIQYIPVEILPEIGNQIKFCEFYNDFTGRSLPYPTDFQQFEYQENNFISRVKRNKQVAIDQQQILNNSKQSIPYPAPLPYFKEVIEDQLNKDNCIKVITSMNRELIEFYNASNYDLSSTGLKNVSLTLLDQYPRLKHHVTNIAATQKIEAWAYLYKKLSSRRNYSKAVKKSKQLKRARVNKRAINTTNENEISNLQMTIDEVARGDEADEGLDALIEAAEAIASRECVHNNFIDPIKEADAEPTVEIKTIINENTVVDVENFTPRKKRAKIETQNEEDEIENDICVVKRADIELLLKLIPEGLLEQKQELDDQFQLQQYVNEKLESQHDSEVENVVQTEEYQKSEIDENNNLVASHCVETASSQNEVQLNTSTINQLELNLLQNDLSE